MEMRPVAVCRGVSVSVVTVRLPVVCPHHPRLVRALFVAHMSVAHSRVHSQNSGCGDRAPRDSSATRTSGGLIGRRHRLPVLKVAAAVTSVGVERHVLLLSGRRLMPDHPWVPRIPGAAQPDDADATMIVKWVTRFVPLAASCARCDR